LDLSPRTETMARRSLDDSRRLLAHKGCHTPSSSVPSTPVIPVRPLSPEKKIHHTEDTSGFLTALASQERLVLELREHLHRAELDLGKLKTKWALHEATKRRTQLQPLNTSISAPRSVDGEELSRSSREQQRHKIVKVDRNNSQRKVFSGSRHMKTLSLLSPTATMEHGANSPSSARPPKSGPRDTERQSTSNIVVEENKPVASPITLASTALTETPNTNLPRDVILDTGKQLVGDFRQGLWTFFEDLRQVTVGDEAVSGSKGGTVWDDPRNILRPNLKPILDTFPSSLERSEALDFLSTNLEIVSYCSQQVHVYILHPGRSSISAHASQLYWSSANLPLTARLAVINQHRQRPPCVAKSMDPLLKTVHYPIRFRRRILGQPPNYASTTCLRSGIVRRLGSVFEKSKGRFCRHRTPGIRGQLNRERTGWKDCSHRMIAWVDFLSTV